MANETNCCCVFRVIRMKPSPAGTFGGKSKQSKEAVGNKFANKPHTFSVKCALWDYIRDPLTGCG